jgi:heme oxygenase
MSADLMSEAIALSSPSGRMSKRARKAANARLAALFQKEMTAIEKKYSKPATDPRIAKRDSLLRHAANLRDLASRGMSPQKFTREATRAETEAATLTLELESKS